MPATVSVAISPGRVQVNGPLGELSQQVPARMRIEQQDGEIVVTRPTERGEDRALHGLAARRLRERPGDALIAERQDWSELGRVADPTGRARCQARPRRCSRRHRRRTISAACGASGGLLGAAPPRRAPRPRPVAAFGEVFGVAMLVEQERADVVHYGAHEQ